MLTSTNAVSRTETPTSSPGGLDSPGEGEEEGAGGGGGSLGAILGGVIAGLLVAVIVIVVIVVILYRRGKLSRRPGKKQGESQQVAPPVSMYTDPPTSAVYGDNNHYEVKR